MSFLDFSRIESSRGDLNRNEKFQISSSDVTLKTDSHYVISDSDLTQIKPSGTPNTKALKWVGIASGVIASVTVVVAIVVCLVVFVGHGYGNDENNKNSTHLPSQKGTSLSPKETTISSMSLTTTTSSIVPTAKSTSTSTPSTSSNPRNATTTPVTSDTTVSSGPESTVGQGTGTWSNWGPWTMCAVTCGDSVHSRYRTCIKNTVNDTNCVGDFKEEKDCTTTTCPVYGTWTTWQSWMDCDVTCGGGTQTRPRSCNTHASTDKDCVGSSMQQQTCNNWACPDCSKVCSTGTLNSECDACECSNLNVLGLVTNTNGGPLQNVNISHISAPYRQLATTNKNGTFEIDNVCAQNEILLKRSGYQDTAVKITSSSITATMQQIQYPIITTQPKSRLRLEGESVEFCCNATGHPAITSYEWLKNGNLLNESLYPDGTKLFLSNVKFVDSGNVICRANSPVGAMFSDSVSLTVRENPDDFCSDAYESYQIDLPSDCVQSDTNSVKYDIGKCSPKPCRKNESNGEQSCTVDKQYCCTTSSQERRLIQCTGYSFPMYVTTACACGECDDLDITINGQAIGLTSGLPLRFGTIEIDGNNVGSTGILGDFTFTVPRGTTRIVVKFKDIYFNQFLDTLKVIRLNEDLSGTFNVHVGMIEKTNPININPAVSNTLQLGNQNGEESIAAITIPPNSIFYPNGTQYDGSVKASINFFDPRNSTNIQNAPGEFVSIDQEGQTQNLQSFGVLSLSLQDQTGSSLQLAGETEIKLDQTFFTTSSLGNLSDAKLWGLNPDTGLWEEQATLNILTSKRRKRQSDLSTLIVGKVTMSAYRTWNIDKIIGAQNCFFKVEALEDGKQVTNYIVRIVYFSNKTSNQITTFKDHFLTRSRPIEAVCRDDALKGYIEVEKDGKKFSVDTMKSTLTSDAINRIKYEVLTSNRTVSVDVIQSGDGPFYPSSSANFNNIFRFTFQSGNYALKIYNYNIKDAYRLKIKGKDVWYPPLNTFSGPSLEYRTCFIKIGTLNANSNLAFRVTSQNDELNFLGIHEKGLTNGATCIEYRCSVQNPDFDLQNRDPETYTFIRITPKGQQCFVDYESKQIREKERDNKKFTLRSNVGKGFFEAFLPRGEVKGTFFQKTKEFPELYHARTVAIEECNTGKHDILNKTMDPNVGLAVIFKCS